MKRKMIGAAAAYMSGLFFASFFNFGSGFWLAVLLAAALAAAVRSFGITKGDIVMLAVFFSAAILSYSVYTNMVYRKTVSFSETSGSFSGEVLSVDYYDGDLASYVLKGNINGETEVKAVYFGDAADVSLGDTVSIESCEFSIPESDFLFDGEAYYKADGIFLSIGNADGISISRNDRHKLKNFLIDYKAKIKSDFVIKLGEESGGLLSGMVFGDKENISDSDRTSMYRSGIGHIIAVSGLHVSIVAAMIMLVLKKLRVNRFVSFAVMIIAVVIMILMADAPISAVRAAIMLVFVYSAGLFRRQNDTFNSLACAALIICIFNPCAIFSRGFILSVAGTFAIGVFAPYMTKNIRIGSRFGGLLKSILQMVCVSVCIMPLNAVYFNEISLIAPLTNVLLIPLCSLALIIGILYVFTGGIFSLLTLVAPIAELVFIITDKLSRISFTYLSCGNKRLSFMAAVCTIFAVFAFILFKNRRITAFAISAAFTVFIFSSALTNSIRRDRFTVAVLGRGTNAAVVVSYKGSVGVIDLSGHYKAADYVERYLTLSGVSRLSYLALTDSVHAQYSAYYSRLQLIETEGILTYGKVKPDEECVIFRNTGFTVDNRDYSVSYADGILHIKYADLTIEVISVKELYSADADLTIAYGRITKETLTRDIHGNVIYLDSSDEINADYSGINNFEIEISENGTVILRRL